MSADAEPIVGRGAAVRAARSSSWLLAEAAIRMAATALVSFWLARRLGPAGYGVLNLASALVVVGGTLATLGLEIPVVARLARASAAESRGLLADLLKLRLVAALGFWLLGSAVVAVLPGTDAQARQVALVALLAIPAALPMLVDHGYRARVEARVPARARTLAGVAGALARIAVVESDLGLDALAGVLVAETLLASLLLWRGWQRLGGFAPRWRDADAQRAWALWRAGLPYLGLAAATLVYTKADLLLVGQLADARAAGIYGAVQKLSEVLYLVPAVVADSVYPLLARTLGARDPARDAAAAQLLFDLVVGAAMLTTLAAQLAAPWVIEPVFGPAYASAVTLFQWHAPTTLALAIELARARWLGSCGQGRRAWPGALAGAAVGLAVNAWAIPQFGAAGGVAGALAAFAACAWLPVWLLPSLRPLAVTQWRALWPWARLWAARTALRR